MPWLYAMTATEKNVDRLWIGVILAIRPLAALSSTTCSYTLITEFGLDKYILFAGILNSIGFIIFAIISLG